MVSVLLAAALYWIAGAASAQPPAADPTAQFSNQPGYPANTSQTPQKGEKKAASSLEGLLAKALKDNSDIRVAESKVREAEAQMNKARMEVMQKVVKLYHEIAAHKALVEIARERFDRVKLLNNRGAIPQEEVSAAGQALQQAKANLAKAEAEMPFLTGSQPVISAVDLRLGQVWWRPPPAQEDNAALRQATVLATEQLHAYYAALSHGTSTVKGSTAEKLRQVLSTPVQGEFTAEKLEKLFQEKVKGFNYYNRAGKVGAVGLPGEPGSKPPEPSIHFKEPVPLGAALQWLEDVKGWRFVVRDYGIVATDPNQAPSGATFLLQQVWKSSQPKTGAKDSAK